MQLTNTAKRTSIFPSNAPRQKAIPGETPGEVLRDATYPKLCFMYGSTAFRKLIGNSCPPAGFSISIPRHGILPNVASTANPSKKPSIHPFPQAHHHCHPPKYLPVQPHPHAPTARLLCSSFPLPGRRPPYHHDPGPPPRIARAVHLLRYMFTCGGDVGGWQGYYFRDWDWERK
jgi:hypothetical protein